jgi:HTH-like domain/Integrase core domain
VSEVFAFIAAEKAAYPVAVLCRALEVNRTSFHDWERRAPSDRALTDAWLTEKVKQVHQDKRRVYGAPRIHAELRMAHGIRVGRKRVERLMRAAGISGLVSKKRGKTTIRVPGVRAADDLVERCFRPSSPNVLWLADITYLRSWEGWLYLAAVQDAYSRKIVGWSMAEHPRPAAKLGQDVAVAHLQAVAVQCEQTRPVEVLGDERGPVERRLGLFVGHLQEEQVRELLDVVATGEPVIAQHVAVVP